MSKGATKKALIREALEIYRDVTNNCTSRDFHLPLCRAFEARGWRMNGAAEKCVAVKGHIVAKWGKPNIYTKNPTRELRRFYRVMRRDGFGKYCPRVYVELSDFIVEQRCRVVLDEHCSHAQRSQRHVIGASIEHFACDIHDENVGWIRNRIKVFDALLPDRERR